MKENSQNLTATPAKSIWLLIISLLTIALGVYVLFNPVTALLAMAVYIGIAFILMGIGYFMIYQDTNSYMMLTLAILDIIVGIIFLANLGVSAVTMPIIFALWTLFVGITQLVGAFQLKERGSSAWGWILALGIIGILFSLLIFIYPMIGVVTLTVLMGGFLIIYGALELVRYLRF